MVDHDDNRRRYSSAAQDVCTGWVGGRPDLVAVQLSINRMAGWSSISCSVVVLWYWLVDRWTTLRVVLLSLRVLVGGRGTMFLLIVQRVTTLVLLTHAVQQKHDEGDGEQEADTSADDRSC